MASAQRLADDVAVVASVLPMARLLEIAQSVATRVPTVRVVSVNAGAATGVVRLSVRELGAQLESLGFEVRVSRMRGVRSVHVSIASFATRRRRLGRVPAGRLRIAGYRAYSSYLHALVGTIRSQEANSVAI